MMNKKTIAEIVMDKNNGFAASRECFSNTRDIFLARMQSYIQETKKYLEAAVIGEIGNNAFDHNFTFEPAAFWGLYCNFSYLGKYTVLADFGRGILQSLLPVLPSLADDAEALEAAFTKKISGRSPEQRGNGMKFVSETVRQNNWPLYFQSGAGVCIIDGSGLHFGTGDIITNGCMAVIDFTAEEKR